MASIIDKRHQPPSDRYYSSRDRFLDRNRGKIREAIDKSLSDSTLEGIGKRGVDVTIPNEGINEPHIHHGKGGVTERVLPGNKQFNAGDRLPKPKGGGGGKNGPEGGEGKGEDDYVFHLSEEEFLNYLFEDMQLPNLIKEGGEDAEKPEYKRSGFSNDGPPNKIDMVRSSAARVSRNVAITKPMEKKRLALMIELRDLLANNLPDGAQAPERLTEEAFNLLPLSRRLAAVDKELGLLRPLTAGLLTEAAQLQADTLDRNIEALDNKQKAIPRWNDIDLKYRRHDAFPVPVTQAVMFCLMDVSGSMDEVKKNNAKLFYMLLYRFLKRNYGKVDVVFIRHTDEAEEVDEHTFFYDQESGGTTVSTSIVKMQEILAERYSLAEWNVYGAQASDGDNSYADNPVCQERLRELLPDVQGYFYTEVTRANGYSLGYDNALWAAYREIAGAYSDKFFMGKIKERSDIWPVFRKFFKKRENYEDAPRASSFARFEPQEP